MKTFKEFKQKLILMEGFDSYKGKSAVPYIKDGSTHHERDGPAPKINDPKEINDGIHGADEARRQISNFHHNAFRKNWEKYDFQGEEPKQDTKARDEFYKKHKLRHPRSTDPEEDSKTAAKYLDHMHHYFPDIAKRYNMKPFKTGGNEEEYKDSEMRSLVQKHGSLPKAKAAKAVNDLMWKVNPEGMHKKTMKDFSAAAHKLKSSGFFDDKGYNLRKVKEFHKDNSDLHHLDAFQVYGHFRDQDSKKLKWLHL